MKGQYKFVQTVFTGPQGSVPVAVKHDYEGAVPMTETERVSRYVAQNGAPVNATDVYTPPAHLTIRQQRQLRRSSRRAIARAVCTCA